MRKSFANAAMIVAFAVAAGGTGEAAAADALDFNRDIRPLLSEHCFQYHGPDADARAADCAWTTQPPPGGC